MQMSYISQTSFCQWPSYSDEVRAAQNKYTSTAFGADLSRINALSVVNAVARDTASSWMILPLSNLVLISQLEKVWAPEDIQNHLYLCRSA